MGNHERNSILTALRTEGDQLTDAILNLEKLAATGGGGKRRGRPPKWLKEAREGKQGAKPDAKKPPKDNGKR